MANSIRPLCGHTLRLRHKSEGPLALPLVLLAPGNAVPGWVTDLPAAAAVAVLARRTGHLLIAVAGGVVLVALLRALLG